MTPKEKIFFPTNERPDQQLYADLIESRSIGGLRGSPVVIRETIWTTAGFRARPGFALNAVDSRNPEESGVEKVEVAGVGRFHFFGSMIGHWHVPVGFSNTREEAVNMGIAPMVPAHKILEVLRQPDLINVMNTLHTKTHEKAQREEGIATFDDSFDKSQKQPFTKKDFETALKKASRKIEPKNK